MTVAFGTSMPSSTTVVATRTSGAPPANARSVSSFASAASAPCSKPTRAGRSWRSRRACCATAVIASSRRATSRTAHTTNTWRPAAIALRARSRRRRAVRWRPHTRPPRPARALTAVRSGTKRPDRRAAPAPGCAGSASPTSTAGGPRQQAVEKLALRRVFQLCLLLIAKETAGSAEKREAFFSALRPRHARARAPPAR